MFRASFKTLTGLIIPQLNDVVITTTSQGLTIWAKGNRKYPIRMSSERFNAVASIDIPEL
jgi:hypothetical protein